MGLKTQDRLNKASPAEHEAKLGDTINNLINKVNSLVTYVNALTTGSNNVITAAPTLVKKAGGSAIVKSSTAFSAFVDGGYVAKSADQDMSAIAGTIATNKSAAWAFYIGPTGTITTSTKTADVATDALALADVLALAVPQNTAKIGHLIIGNAQAASASFTAGTTALDATGVTPTYASATAVDLSIPSLTTLVEL
jgi:hypothetical protein